MNPGIGSLRMVSCASVSVVALAIGLLTTLPKAFSAVPEAVQPKVQPFALSQVRLLEGLFRDAMLRDKAYLERLEPDRLLHSFRQTAGFSSTAEPYGGWEKPQGELRGHTMGHYLSACALMAASTGDENLKKRTDYLVAELAKCQEAMPSQGYNKGFLSAYPEEFFDRVDTGKRVWAPYYTLHKIMAGLLDVHQQCGNPQALKVLVNMADWLKFRVDRLSKEQMQAALRTEYGGMNEVLANLYAVTGNPDHLKLARAFNHELIFEPLARGEDKLNGRHANTQIPKIIGAARQYELTGEKPFQTIATNFWSFVALNRSYCIGGHSEREFFFPVSEFSKHLGPATAETCNTYNMLKLTRHLFSWEPTAREMDFYERGLFNQILGSQDPATGMMLYFASLRPGHFKDYCTPEHSFWCCTGSGLENHAKYGDSIYFHGPETLYVNLFIASTLDWKEKELSVRQETHFPESDTTRLTFSCPKKTRLAVKIRRPAWAAQGAILSINGQAVSADGSPGSYFAIERDWQNGDTLEARFPMALHTEAMPDNPHVLALLYGPIVLAGELGNAGLETLPPYSKMQLDHARVPAPEAPVLVCEEDLLSHIHPVEGKPLNFRTQGIGQPQDVSLIPYYQLHHQRFNVYWQQLTEKEWALRKETLAATAARREAFEARIIDEVQPGEQQPETDHNWAGERTATGIFQDRKYREARGWFSYDVAVKPDLPVTLRCTFWGSDSGRTFQILVNGVTIAEQKLERKQPNAFLEVDFPVPGDLTRGKQKVTVRFEAHPGEVAGGLFHLLVLKP